MLAEKHNWISWDVLAFKRNFSFAGHLARLALWDESRPSFLILNWLNYDFLEDNDAFLWTSVSVTTALTMFLTKHASNELSCSCTLLLVNILLSNYATGSHLSIQCYCTGSWKAGGSARGLGTRNAARATQEPPETT